MRILITGAGGQLGRELQRSLAGETVFPLGHGELDVTDLEACHRVVRELRPEVVIHSAAYTDVDGCETNPDRAYMVNATATRNVATACSEQDATLVYISTDYVFDGTKGSPYVETDEPNPVSKYGSSKLEGERYVMASLARHYIVRTSWLYSNYARNFVKTILSRAPQGDLLGVVDEIGSPTFAADLADGLARLVHHNSYGIFHLANEGSCSRCEWINAIVGMAGIPAAVRPVTAEEFLAAYPLLAQRPRNSTLRNCRAANDLGIALRPWREALSEMLEIEIGNQQ